MLKDKSRGSFGVDSLRCTDVNANVSWMFHIGLYHICAARLELVLNS